MAAEPGWYADPQGPGRRWWDGRAWTEYTDDVMGPEFSPLAPVAPPASPVAAPAYDVNAAWTPSPVAPGYVGPPPVGVWQGPIDDRPWVQNLGDAVRVVLTKYAQFRGRASRSEFWYWQLFLVLGYFGAFALSLIPFIGLVFGVVVVLGLFGVIVPTYAVAVRRLRDAGLHWALLFVALVPFGSIVLIVLWCQPSKHP